MIWEFLQKFRLRERVEISGLAQRGRARSLALSQAGAVVLELAISIPVFLGLLYYIHDVPKYQRIHNRIKFCTICAANMFQNISMHRSDKKIYQRDLYKIRAASAIPFFGTVTNMKFGSSANYWWACYFICLQGVGTNQARIKWRVRQADNGLPTASSGFSDHTNQLTAFPQSYSTTINTQTIGSGFSINNEEFVIISEMSLVPAYPNPPTNAKKYYNFLVLSPRPLKSAANYAKCCFFDNFTPFSPKPGLVTTTAPS